MNSFGSLFRLTSFGESHGAAIGGIIDGMPSGIEVDIDFIQSELARRKPGQSHLTTARKEADEVELLSGIFEGRTTGTPIGFLVRNTNQHSQDYEEMRNVYRPSHADFTYEQKYGIRDHRGGGRSSARETISRVVAGAFAKLALRQLGTMLENIIRHHNGKHRVAQKFQSFVVLDVLRLVLIGVGGMRDRLAQERLIIEMISDFVFQFQHGCVLQYYKAEVISSIAFPET